MSAPLSPHMFSHTLPEDMVCAAATLLLDRWVEDGGDPEGLDYRNFLAEGVGIWAADQAQRAQALGLSPAGPRWSLMANGDARVIFPLPTVQEAVLFKAWVI